MHISGEDLGNGVPGGRSLPNRILAPIGADPNLSVVPSGNNALFAAVTSNRIDAVRLLFAKGGQPRQHQFLRHACHDSALAAGIFPWPWGPVTEAPRSRTFPGSMHGRSLPDEVIGSSGALRKGETDEPLRKAVAMGQLDHSRVSRRYRRQAYSWEVSC